MKKVYTLVLMILTFLLGTTGCGEMSSTKYGVLPSDFDPNPTQDEDVEPDEELDELIHDEVPEVDSNEI